MEENKIDLNTESVADDINIELSTEITEVLSQENTENSTESLVEVSPSDSQIANDNEILTSINTYITIICIVVVVWFCAWSMRAWRFWTSKVGRRL